MEPFARDMVRDHTRFAGRWGELQQLCTALDQRTPALLVGVRQSGRSSLLYHLVHAAPALFDQPQMQSYYIDLQQCADITTLRETVARAFQQSPAHWLAHLINLVAPPLLAFDNIDAPHLVHALEAWWQELLPAVRAGSLRVVGACITPPETTFPWRAVPLRRVDGVMLDDIVNAQLGDDGGRLSRTDNHWMIQHSRGHIGVLMAYLRAWYHAQQHPSVDWRAAVGHIPVSDASLADPSLVTAPVTEWYVSDEALGATASSPASSVVPVPSTPAITFEMPVILWVIGGLCIVVLVWLIWQGLQ